MFVEQATECYFDSVHFVGVGTTANITAADADAAISIRSTAAITTKNITFDKCSTSGTGFGLELSQGARGITFSNGQFDTHYKGVILSDGAALGSPTGVRISQNTFDDILAQGIEFGTSTTLNISAFNAFYDVGNTFGGAAAFTIVDILNGNNASYGDMFERLDADNVGFPRIELNETGSIGFDSSNKIELGTYVRDVGRVTTLADATGPVAAFTVDLLDSTTLNASLNAFNINYTIERGDEIRTGVINVASTSGANTISYNDTFTSNVASTVTLAVTQTGTDVSLNYTTTATGTAATLSYSIVRLY
jgi:hypothetical protein